MAFSCARRNHFFRLYSTQVFLRHYTPNRGRWKREVFLRLYPYKRQPHKMVKHTQTIRRQFADELFECV